MWQKKLDLEALPHRLRVSDPEATSVLYIQPLVFMDKTCTVSGPERKTSMLDFCSLSWWFCHFCEGNMMKRKSSDIVLHVSWWAWLIREQHLVCHRSHSWNNKILWLYNSSDKITIIINNNVYSEPSILVHTLDGVSGILYYLWQNVSLSWY